MRVISGTIADTLYRYASHHQPVSGSELGLPGLCRVVNRGRGCGSWAGKHPLPVRFSGVIFDDLTLCKGKPLWHAFAIFFRTVTVWLTGFRVIPDYVTYRLCQDNYNGW